MEIITKHWTANTSLQNPKLLPVGIMIHSTATPGVMAKGWYDRWNKPGLGKSVHFFVDDKEAWNYLPLNVRAAHAGNPANQMYISIEICEDKNHTAQYFELAFANAVELTAQLCRKYGFNVSDVISHEEGSKRGIATGHIDPTHWWDKFGKTMDDFRAEVQKQLTPAIAANASEKPLYVTIGNKVITGKLIDGVTWVPLRETIDTIRDNLTVTWSSETGAGVTL